MTHSELDRRVASCNHTDFLRAVLMARDGYGGYGITLQTPLTLKQANAAHEWVRRYGSLNPPTWKCRDMNNILRAGPSRWPVQS